MRVTMSTEHRRTAGHRTATVLPLTDSARATPSAMPWLVQWLVPSSMLIMDCANDLHLWLKLASVVSPLSPYSIASPSMIHLLPVNTEQGRP